MSGDVTADLIGALIEHTGGADGWESLSMILELPEGTFNEAHGYAYLPGGTVDPVAVNPRAVAPAVDAYTASHYEPGEALPLKILVQFDRATGRYEVTFEDRDETRWKATPRNFRQLREDLRPRFA
jgi:hypothetical protein